MIYIIGVGHRVQCTREGVAESEDHRSFRTVLTRSIERFNPVIVGEELSSYVLTEVTKETGTECRSVAKMISDSFHIEHRYCDPDPQARAEMNYKEVAQLVMESPIEDDVGLSNDEINARAYAIQVAKYWPLREQFWLDQLGDTITKNLVFVCGDAHVEGFSELLKRNNIDSTVVDRHIGVTREDDDIWNRVLAYRSAHPEICR